MRTTLLLAFLIVAVALGESGNQRHDKKCVTVNTSRIAQDFVQLQTSSTVGRQINNMTNGLIENANTMRAAAVDSKDSLKKSREDKVVQNANKPRATEHILSDNRNASNINAKTDAKNDPKTDTDSIARDASSDAMSDAIIELINKRGFQGESTDEEKRMLDKLDYYAPGDPEMHKSNNEMIAEHKHCTDSETCGCESLDFPNYEEVDEPQPVIYERSVVDMKNPRNTFIDDDWLKAQRKNKNKESAIDSNIPNKDQDTNINGLKHNLCIVEIMGTKDMDTNTNTNCNTNSYTNNDINSLDNIHGDENSADLKVAQKPLRNQLWEWKELENLQQSLIKQRKMLEQQKLREEQRQKEHGYVASSYEPREKDPGRLIPPYKPRGRDPQMRVLPPYKSGEKELLSMNPPFDQRDLDQLLKVPPFEQREREPPRVIPSFEQRNRVPTRVIQPFEQRESPLTLSSQRVMSPYEQLEREPLKGSATYAQREREQLRKMPSFEEDISDEDATKALCEPEFKDEQNPTHYNRKHISHGAHQLTQQQKQQQMENLRQLIELMQFEESGQIPKETFFDFANSILYKVIGLYHVGKYLIHRHQSGDLPDHDRSRFTDVQKPPETQNLMTASIANNDYDTSDYTYNGNSKNNDLTAPITVKAAMEPNLPSFDAQPEPYSNSAAQDAVVRFMASNYRNKQREQPELCCPIHRELDKKSPDYFANVDYEDPTDGEVVCSCRYRPNSGDSRNNHPSRDTHIKRNIRNSKANTKRNNRGKRNYRKKAYNTHNTYDI